MQYGTLTTIGALALALGAGACNRDAAESRDAAATGTSSTADRAVELQRERDAEITRFDERIRDIDRDYTEASQEVTSGEKTATAGLREELREDVANVKQAVADLRTTTPENWWDRHEQAVRRSADDIGEDVRRLAGPSAARPEATTGTTGEGVSTAPFESRRDRLVTDMRARVDAMKRALDGVKADGARETEVEDARARINKLGDDLDKLAGSSADDWWTVSRTRVTEYIDRVEGSVDRLDNDDTP